MKSPLEYAKAIVGAVVAVIGAITASLVAQHVDVPLWLTLVGTAGATLVSVYATPNAKPAGSPAMPDMSAELARIMDQVQQRAASQVLDAIRAAATLPATAPEPGAGGADGPGPEIGAPDPVPGGLSDVSRETSATPVTPASVEGGALGALHPTE